MTVRVQRQNGFQGCTLRLIKNRGRGCIGLESLFRWARTDARERPPNRALLARLNPDHGALEHASVDCMHWLQCDCASWRWCWRPLGVELVSRCRARALCLAFWAILTLRFYKRRSPQRLCLRRLLRRSVFSSLLLEKSKTRRMRAAAWSNTGFLLGHGALRRVVGPGDREHPPGALGPP